MQLLLFIHSIEASLALPGPAWFSRWAGWGLGVVVGRLGGWLLGYRSCYEEYYDEGLGKRV